jgi:hypothetical protein
LIEQRLVQVTGLDGGGELEVADSEVRRHIQVRSSDRTAGNVSC